MLKFIYGVMGSSKSAQALMIKCDYEKEGFDVILLKSMLDGKDDVVESRVGIYSKGIGFNPDDNLTEIISKNFKKYNTIVVVDECQFCTKKQIEQLKQVSALHDVFCYGLKINVRGELFEGSKRLFEMADEFEEIKSICHCGKKAAFNVLIKDEKICTDTDSSDYDYYRSVCYDCWRNLV